MADIIEYARCTCGGNHGYVPVHVAADTNKRWCVYAWNERFSACPACKARRADGKCAFGCRKCRTHGWHKGRTCTACADARPRVGKLFGKWVVTPVIWTFLIAVAVGYGLLLLAGFLLTIPFTTMLGQWFVDNGFPIIGWGIILPIPLIVVAAVFAIATIREWLR